MQNRIIETNHLFRRTGFGANSAQIREFAKLSHQEAIAQLLNFDPTEILKKYDLEAYIRKQTNAVSEWYAQTMSQAWLNIMLETPRPLIEKMALFWHGHFTSSLNKVSDSRLMLNQVNYFRQHALGNFRDMVHYIVTDPAMLIYLDGVENSVEGVNENFARELLELFTLGIGNYTEPDIREAARAFTGWYISDYGDGASGTKVDYNPDYHDNGLKTFMGQTGYFDGTAIVDILLKKRQVAYFISRKLWEFLVYPDPDGFLIKRLGDVFYDSNYDIKKLVQSILLSPEFLTEKAYRSLVKSPVDLLIGTGRSLAIKTVDSWWLELMGQSLFAPPNVRGWLGGKSWINSATIVTRLNLGNDLLYFDTPDPAYSPYLFKLLNDKTLSPQKFYEELATVLLDDQTQAKPTILEFIQLPYQSNADDTEDRLGEINSKIRGAIHLMLTCPEYQLA
jgi:uncharacterized protein (DUF1800 family)